jgi:uncharacterized phiE125 gp8 family phage protein
MASIVITPPTQEPVTLDMVKSQSRITHTLDDALLQGYITSARDYLQIVTRRQFVAATLQWTGFQHPLGLVTLDAPPLVSVSQVATLAGNIATILDPTAYVALTHTEPGQVALLSAPSLLTPIRVTYVAGWPSPEAMPPSLRQAMLLLIAHWYEHREASTMERMMCLPYALESLIWANKLVTA